MFKDNRCMDMGMGTMSKTEMHKEYMHEAKTMPTEGMGMAMPMGGMNMGMGCCPMPGMVCPPVMECPQERCVHREIVHEVPHVQPVNTRIINHHIYRHTFQPAFSCCEENVCSNVYEPHCGC